jgi:hypothetical protein
MDPDALYSITRAGQQYGPYPVDELKRGIAQGNIVGTDLVWTPGMPGWVPVSELVPGAALPPPPASAHALTAYRRPPIISLLAVMQVIGGGLLAIAAIDLFFIAPQNVVGLASLWLLLAIVDIVCGVGLWRLRPYGRLILEVLSWIGLIAFPIGTIVSVLTLAYLRKPGIRLLFSGTPPERLRPEQVAEVQAAMAGGRGAVAVTIALVGVLLVVSIIAAIARPDLVREALPGGSASPFGVLQPTSTPRTPPTGT